MGVEAQPRPNVLIPLLGAGMVGLAVARLVSGPGPGGPGRAAAVGASGVALAAWGVGRLRRAKAARPGVSWWGLLRGQVAALGVAAALLPATAAVPQAERDDRLRAAREWFELVHAARAH